MPNKETKRKVCVVNDDVCIDVSDESSFAVLSECLNLVNGEPKEIDFTLRGNMNDIDIVLQ